MTRGRRCEGPGLSLFGCGLASPFSAPAPIAPGPEKRSGGGGGGRYMSRCPIPLREGNKSPASDHCRGVPMSWGRCPAHAPRAASPHRRRALFGASVGGTPSCGCGRLPCDASAHVTDPHYPRPFVAESTKSGTGCRGMASNPPPPV